MRDARRRRRAWHGWRARRAHPPVGRVAIRRGISWILLPAAAIWVWSGCVGPLVRAARPPLTPPVDRRPEYATAAQRWRGFGDEILALVNRDRLAAGLLPLASDEEALSFADQEAERLAREGSFAHVARDGSKPYQRWAREGHTAHLRENLYEIEASDGPAYAVFDPAAAHTRLMGSAGHRANVLDPAHTGAGVAVAYDAERNRVIVVEEFVNRYVNLEPGKVRWRAGESRLLRGRVEPGARVVPWMAVLYREAVPGGVSAHRKARRSSYREGSRETALVLSRSALWFDSVTGDFELGADLPARSAPGPYTLILYVASAERGASGSGRRSTAEGFPVAVASYEVER